LPSDVVVLDAAECSENMLENMDKFVGCVEGVHSQHEFDLNTGTKEFVELYSPSHQSLSQAEATLIRLQLTQSSQQKQSTSVIPDLDVLNLCGSDDEATKKLEETKKSKRTAETADESFSDKYGNADKLDTPYHMCSICQSKSTAEKKVTFCQFPCCSDEQGVRICTSCLLVVTTATKQGSHRIGHCPRCRTWIRVKAPTSTTQQQLDIEPVTLGEPTCVCKICNQTKEYLLDEEECDACFLGQRNPLLYECKRCQCVQRIPHPLYRYQDTPDSFGTVKWSCQGRACGGFSYWRILSDQVALIPIGDTPSAWAVDSIQAARQRVLTTRQLIAAEDASKASLCVIS
jgi:hypothetical protein